VECLGCFATLADLLIFAAELPQNLAGRATGQALSQIIRLTKPAAADGGIASHAGQKLLDVVPLLGHFGEALDVSWWRIGKLAAGFASRLQSNAAHHVAPAA